MDTFIYVIRHTFYYLIVIMQLMMLARVVMSLFLSGQRNRIFTFVFTVTEYIIYPVRKLYERFGKSQRGPFDVPFFITLILLMILQMFFQI